jgi:hypothetical protein
MKKLSMILTLLCIACSGYSQVKTEIRGPDSLCVGQNSEYFVKIERYPNRYLQSDGSAAGILDAGYSPDIISGTFTYDFRINPQKPIDIRSAKCENPEDDPNLLNNTSQNWAIFPAFSADGNAVTGVSVGTNGIVVAERSGENISAILYYPVQIIGWIHVAVVFRTDSLFLFLDGKQVKSMELSQDVVRCVSPLLSGGSEPNNFTGDFDEFRLWDRALTEEEIELMREKKLLGHVYGLRFYTGFDTGDFQKTSGDLGNAQLSVTGYTTSQLKTSSWDIDLYSGPDIKNLTIFNEHNLSYLWSTGTTNASMDYSPLSGKNMIYVKIYNPLISKNALFSLIDSISVTGTLCANTPEEGLVAYYPFNGTAKDICVFRNDGTVMGAEACTDMYGAANGALFFDGENDLVRINGALPVAGTLTISFLAFSLRESGYSVILNDGGSGSSGSSFILDFQGNDIGIKADKDASLNHDEFVIPELQNLDLVNKWTHVVWVMTPSFSQIYVNGELKVNIFESGSNTGYHNEYSYVGARQGVNSPEDYFKGKLDELKIYNRKLSDDEIQALYQSYKTGTVKSAHSLEEPNMAKLYVYPNPATEYVVVDASGLDDFEEDGVRVISMSGTTLFTGRISSCRNQINVPELKGQGMCIIQVLNPEGAVRASTKIIFK